MENQCRQAVLEEDERKKKEKAAEAKRVEQRTSKHFAEQAQLETVQMAEQDTARQLVAEASQKLFAAVQGTANSLQDAKVAQCTGYANCG